MSWIEMLVGTSLMTYLTGRSDSIVHGNCRSCGLPSTSTLNQPASTFYSSLPMKIFSRELLVEMAYSTCGVRVVEIKFLLVVRYLVVFFHFRLDRQGWVEWSLQEFVWNNIAEGIGGVVNFLWCKGMIRFAGLRIKIKIRKLPKYA